MCEIIILIIISFLLLFPLYIPIINSVKTLKNLFTAPFSIPEAFIWSNYAVAWVEGNLLRLSINTIIVTSGTVLSIIVMSSIVAYALTRKKTFRNLNRMIFTFFIIGIMIPPHVAIIPLYLQMKFLSHLKRKVH